MKAHYGSSPWLPQAEAKFVLRRFVRIAMGCTCGSICSTVAFGQSELDLAGRRVGASGVPLVVATRRGSAVDSCGWWCYPLVNLGDLMFDLCLFDSEMMVDG